MSASASAVQLLSAVLAVAAVIQAVATVRNAARPPGGATGLAMWSTVRPGPFTDVVAVLWMTAWIATSVWLTEVRRNANALAPGRIRLETFWCWCGWWMPVVSLWFPLRIVGDSYRITARALRGDAQEERPLSLRPWWLLWVAYMLMLGVDGSRQAWHLGGDWPWLTVATAAVEVAAYVAWARVAARLSRIQEDLAATW